MAKKYIEFIQRVTFKDNQGSVVKVYEVGDIEEWFCRVGQSGSDYFVTGIGGIWTTEAMEVST